jgi:KUP system potassium uptake protein
MAALSLGALGVVFGDLGTSPLYTFSSCFTAENGLAPTPDNVLGVVSLIFWSLVIVVCLKYEALVLRADNNGEGGILALLALLNPWRKKRTRLLVAMGLFGAALLYGDGMLTPAISVLSALEGLQLGSISLSRPVIIGLTLAVLVGLFALQKRGTGPIGALFGPIMVLWFLVIGVLGLAAILKNPAVLAALNPLYAWRFIFGHGFADIVVLGAVFLCLTGAEALYADIGHFGRTPIRVAWFALVMPTLVLSYFGQGALLLLHPDEGAGATFYGLAPGWFLYPLVGLATVATVIASQSIICGAFSLMAQAINLGQSPRLTVVHTSAGERGQIYIPALNFVMMIGTIAIVLGFKTSANLATAYGVAVSSTMVVTTVLMFFAMRDIWHWKFWIVWPITAGLLAVDLMYFCANVFKITDGGWLPLLIGLIGFTLMSTWSTGRENLIARLRAGTEPLDRFLERVRELRPARVEGTGIFLAAPNLGTPPMLQRHLELNKVLPRQVVLLTVQTADVPYIHPIHRLDCQLLSEGFYTVAVRYGFMQSPDVPQALRVARRFGLEIVPETTIYYVGRETFVAGGRIPGLAAWRAKLFAFLSRNALRATDFYRIPPERTVEIGIRLRLNELQVKSAAARVQPDLS